MRTEKIINSLKVCAGAGRCDNCEYRHETYQEGCEVKLNKYAALRLEELCDRIEEYEERIDKARKTIHELIERNDELKSKLNKGAGLWISVNDRLPDTELAKCLVFLYGEVCFSYFHRGEFHSPDVTHWMEIPEPPKKVKTYTDVYLDRMKEAFPEAVLDGSVTGKCRNKLFGINKPCTYQCRDCWNQPYPEEEGGAK